MDAGRKQEEGEELLFSFKPLSLTFRSKKGLYGVKITEMEPLCHV